MPASTEVKQLELICELLGTPNVRIWPALESLPLWPKLQAGLPENEYNELPTRFARIRPTQATLELLNALLTYDPAKRITAHDAMPHRWLRSDGPSPTKSVASIAAPASTSAAASRKPPAGQGGVQLSSEKIPRAPPPQAAVAHARLPSPSGADAIYARLL